MSRFVSNSARCWRRLFLVSVLITFLSIWYSEILANEGPSLQDTLTWIRDKWAEEGGSHFHSDIEDTDYVPDTAAPMSWNGCVISVRMIEKYDGGGTRPINRVKYQTKTTISVPLTHIDENGISVERSDWQSTTFVKVKTVGPKVIEVKNQQSGFSAGSSQSMHNSYTLFRFTLANEDIARRIEKALRHAIQSCPHARAPKEPF